MKRAKLSVLVLGAMGAAALAIAKRKPRSPLNAAVAPSTAIADIETAVEAIERTEQRRGAMRFLWANAPRRLASLARRRLDRSVAADSEVSTVTAQPSTTIPAEQQPGGGPPHR